MSTLPPALADLAMLAHAHQRASEYYAPLLDSDDPVLKVGAWCALLDREEVTVEQYPRVIELAAYGAIQRRAFRFFQANWEHDLAAVVAAKVATSPAAARALAWRAELTCDDRAAVEAQRYRFLATGRFDALVNMVHNDEKAVGWRPALALATKVCVLNPHDPMAAHLVLHLLHEARETELLEAALVLLEANNLHRYLATAYRAVLQLLTGRPKECIATLHMLDVMRPPRADLLAVVRPMALQVNAEAIEKSGDFRKAYQAYADFNRLEQGKPVSLDDFATVTLAAAARDVPPLPPDDKTNHFVMTGFPRSGTTLLENALSAHPRIETFEEIPSSAAMETYLQTALPRVHRSDDLVVTYLRARERYYDEALRRGRKLGADLFVDKLPMRSAQAGFMSKVFSDKRYIFSIRHPFDVVLSCFKQFFGRNIAMEHFRTFEGAVKLYDFTMQQWFAVHTLDDPNVCYVRYDTLVADFETTVRRALDFLGADWDPNVLNFASLADTRSARTPSYPKVRQGLSLGVQTAWRNYGFLFQSEAAQPLHRWARFFGYPAE